MLIFVRNRKVLRVLVIVLLSVYCIVLAVGVLSNFYYTTKVMHVYFDFSYTVSKTIDLNIFHNGKIDMIINILMLIPVGISIVVLNNHNIKVMNVLLLTIGFCVGFTIELLQLILPIARAVQLIDVILNGLSVILGGVIGILYVKLVNKILTKKIK